MTTRPMTTRPVTTRPVIAAAHGLRVEHLHDALGIRTPAPRLSWRLPDGAREQLAYRITADTGWDSGWVDSPQQLLVPYAGPPLVSSQRVGWQVQVRTDLGESPSSQTGRFETGLLWSEDWQASWVEPGLMPGGVKGERPAALLRAEFDLARPVVAARLHATAQGLYEAFLNGERVGDAELTPGFTQYNGRLQVQTFDVTSLVRMGRNGFVSSCPMGGSVVSSASPGSPINGANGWRSWLSSTSCTRTAVSP